MLNNFIFYNSFNDAANGFVCIASDSVMIMAEVYCGRRRDLVLSQNLTVGTQDYHESLSQDSRCSDLDSNRQFSNVNLNH
jgi:hypothetical protein